MSPWMIGLALAVGIAIISLSYLWLVRRNHAENTLGLRALAGLRWREFSTLVGQAMQRRGLRDSGRDPDDESPGDGGSRMQMTDGGTRWLLACKHGLAYQITPAHVEELAAEMELSGAHSGMLLTEGRADREAFATAQKLRVEIVDSRRLWPLLKPFMPSDTVRQIVSSVDAQAKRHSLIAVLGALAVGAVTGLLLPDRISFGQTEPAPTAAQTTSTAPLPPSPAQTSEPALEPGIEADPDPATLARYRVDLTRTLSRSPGITRAYWLTQTTLVIDRVGTDTGVWPQVCAELVRYPSLRTVRVQLNPRPDTKEPVRWRQCRTM